MLRGSLREPTQATRATRGPDSELGRPGPGPRPPGPGWDFPHCQWQLYTPLLGDCQGQSQYIRCMSGREGGTDGHSVGGNNTRERALSRSIHWYHDQRISSTGSATSSYSKNFWPAQNFYWLCLCPNTSLGTVAQDHHYIIPPATTSLTGTVPVANIFSVSCHKLSPA